MKGYDDGRPEQRCPSLPPNVLHQILAPLGCLQQITLGRVSPVFQAAMPLKDVDLTEVHKHLHAKTTNTPEQTWLRDLAVCAKHMPTTGRVICLRESIGEYVDVDESRALVEVFPNCKFWALPMCDLVIRSLELFGSIKMLHCGGFHAEGHGLTARRLEVLQGIDRLEVRIISMDALRAITARAKESLSSVIIQGLIKAPVYEHLPCAFMEADLMSMRHHFVNLRTIEIRGLSMHIDDPADIDGRSRIMDLRAFRIFPHLKQLSLRLLFIRHTANSSPNPLPSSLEARVLTGCESVTDFSFLRSLPKLRRLHLRSGVLNRSDLKWLDQRITLTHLNVSYTKVVSDQLIDFLIDRQYPIEILQCQKLGDDVGGLTSKGVQRFVGSSLCLQFINLRGNVNVDEGTFSSDSNFLRHLAWLGIYETGCNSGEFFQLIAKRKSLREASFKLPGLVLNLSLEQLPSANVCSQMRLEGITIITDEFVDRSCLV